MYKIFAVLHLRIRLFPLLTAWKENGTGVYAGISFHEFYTFFLFNLLICSFFVLFSYFFYSFSIPVTFTRGDLYFIKLIFLFYFSILFFYPRHLPTPTPTPTTHDPRPTTFSYTRDFWGETVVFLAVARAGVMRAMFPVPTPLPLLVKC